MFDVPKNCSSFVPKLRSARWGACGGLGAPRPRAHTHIAAVQRDPSTLAHIGANSQSLDWASLAPPSGRHTDDRIGTSAYVVPCIRIRTVRTHTRAACVVHVAGTVLPPAGTLTLAQRARPSRRSREPVPNSGRGEVWRHSRICMPCITGRLPGQRQIAHSVGRPARVRDAAAGWQCCGWQA